MEENTKSEVDLKVKKEEVKKNVTGLLGGIREFLSELLNIKKDTNKEGTIQEIKDNISMQGHTAWILIFSILIASIGLNANSTAVVIGAMLISPLMGPILGVGLSIGINDIDTLRKSMINLGVMVGLSLITSFVFFSIPFPGRTLKHVADIDSKSAAKRINMFLRWMVRKDDRGVDFGLWDEIPMSALYIPLDLHSGKAARELGLLKRKQSDWKSVSYLTHRLREFDRDDPVKYDYALFGLSAIGKNL